MDKNINIPILLDIYGQALSKIQFDSLDLYYNEDLSLSEIADNLGKTRQGVFDSIKRAEATLMNFEEELGLWKKFEQFKADLNNIKNMAEKVKKLNITEAKELAGSIISCVDNIKFY